MLKNKPPQKATNEKVSCLDHTFTNATLWLAGTQLLGKIKMAEYTNIYLKRHHQRTKCGITESSTPCLKLEQVSLVVQLFWRSVQICCVVSWPRSTTTGLHNKSDIVKWRDIFRQMWGLPIPDQHLACTDEKVVESWHLFSDIPQVLQ